MAGKIAPFLVGSTCEVRVGSHTVMFGQNIDLRDSFSHTLPMGLGEFASKSNEPLHYPGGSVSMTLLSYSNAVLGIPETMSGVDGVTALQARGTNKVKRSDNESSDGNSLAFVEGLSPALMMFESTLDIIIYAKVKSEGGVESSIPVYICKDCYLESYATGANAASLVSEQFSYRARVIIDVQNEPDKYLQN